MTEASMAALADRLRERDEAKAEGDKLIGAQMRAALKVLAPLIANLPSTDTYLLAPQAVDAWRTMRDGDAETYLVYLSAVRVKCGNNVALLVANRVGQAGAASHEPLPGYTTAEIWDAYEPPPYLAKRLLSPGAVTVLFGQSGHLKSVIAIDLTLCVATGTPFHGIRTRRAGVLYVAGEGHAGIRKRIRAWLIHKGMNSASEPPTAFVTSAGTDLMGNPEQLRATCAHAAEVVGCAIELIVIDTLAANFGAGDENHTFGDTAGAAITVARGGTQRGISIVHAAL